MNGKEAKQNSGTRDGKRKCKRVTLLKKFVISEGELSCFVGIFIPI